MHEPHGWMHSITLAESAMGHGMEYEKPLLTPKSAGEQPNTRIRMEPQHSTKTPATEASSPSSSSNISGIRRFIREARKLHEREKSRIRDGIVQIPGLMALLMKSRNGQRWSKTERQELRKQLRGLSRLSLYFAMAALPFTTLALPLVAWWLDRRQRQRANDPSSNATP